jgi:hypothetical protein
MQRGARLWLWAASATLSLLLATLISSAAPGTVQPLVRITGASPFPQGCQGNTNPFFGQGFDGAEVESMVAVNPADPQNLIATWFQDASLAYLVASSHDGGQTWMQTTIPGVSRCSGGKAQGAADSWLSIGPDGTAYLSGFSVFLDAYPPAALPTRTTLDVSRSSDGGLTWSSPAIVSGAVGLFHDRPVVTADPARAGSAYVVWNDGTQIPPSPEQPILFSRSDDFGATWSVPTLAFLPKVGIAHDAKVLVLPGGDLMIVAVDVRAFPLPHVVVAVRSKDGGRTWSQGKTIAQIPSSHYPSLPGDCRNVGAPIRDSETGKCLQTNEFELYSDAGSDGKVFVAWRHPLSDTTSVIRFSKSVDGGETWSRPANASPATSHVFLPALAISRTDGTVGISFYDLRNDVPGDAGLSTDVWLVHSHDGGSTWQENHVAGPFDFRSAPQRLIPVEGLFLGDYQGLVPLPGGFGAVFGMSKPLAVDGATDLFFAHILTP